MQSLDVEAIGVQSLQYSTDGGVTTFDVPGTNSISVAQGATVTFTAQPDPTDAGWPAGQLTWINATAGATVGQATQTYLTTGGPNTVTVTCGSSSQSVDVTVVNVGSLQYSLDEGLTYQAVPDTLYVPNGQDIYFEAISNPTNVVWPTGNPVWTSTGVTITVPDPDNHPEIAIASFSTVSGDIAMQSQASPEKTIARNRFKANRSQLITSTTGINTTVECGNSLTETIVPVSVSDMQYSLDGGITYSDVTGTIYIPTGKTINFKALSSETGGNWPNGILPNWKLPDNTHSKTDKLQYTFNIDSQSDTDYKTVSVTLGNATPLAANIVTFSITGLSVANASQIDNSDWGTIKQDTGNVDIYVTLTQNIQNIPDGVITWTGGNALQGEPLHRTVSKSVSTTTQITASAGNVTKSIMIWVIWGSVTINTTSIPAGAIAFPRHGTLLATQTGPLDWTDEDGEVHTTLRYVAEGLITPSGINRIIGGEWNFTRMIMPHDWNLYVEVLPYDFINTWRTDSASYVNSIPGSNDTIYDTDSPECGPGLSNIEAFEVNENFYEYITWNGVLSSDQAYFNYKAFVTDHVVANYYNTNGLSQIVPLPGDDDLISGTVFYNGVGLKDVTVTVGDHTAITGSDGTYRITGISPGTYVVSAALGGYTITAIENPVTIEHKVGQTNVACGHLVNISFTATMP